MKMEIDIVTNYTDKVIGKLTIEGNLTNKDFREKAKGLIDFLAEYNHRTGSPDE